MGRTNGWIDGRTDGWMNRYDQANSRFSQLVCERVYKFNVLKRSKAHECQGESV
jgi:hypothetical protein